jgi:hypothetical protein
MLTTDGLAAKYPRQAAKAGHGLTMWLRLEVTMDSLGPVARSCIRIRKDFNETATGLQRKDGKVLKVPYDI